MTPIQTDREAVERLALRSDATAAAHKATSPCCGEDDPCVAPACHFGEVMRGLQDGAATLRALRAALDAAEQRAVEAAVLATENEGAFKVWRRRAQEAEAQLATARAAIHKEGQSDAG